MGYTHYWNRTADFTQKEWDKICFDIFEVITKYCEPNGIKIVRDKDEDSHPLINNQQIHLNGYKDEAYETFFVNKKIKNQYFKNGESFDFCKTQRRPYDMMVMLALLIMKNHASKTFSYSSDGNWNEEWKPAKKIFKEIFKINPS